MAGGIWTFVLSSSSGQDVWSESLVTELEGDVLGITSQPGESVLVTANGEIGRSVGGGEWTRVLSDAGFLQSVGWWAGRYYATGEGGVVLSSADSGESWVSEAVGTSEFLSDTAGGEGVLVAVGGAGEIVWRRDEDGSWDRSESGVDVFLSSVAYGEGRFVAVGVGGEIVFSDDALLWGRAESGVVASLSGVEFAGGRFVAVGSGGTVIVSNDGKNWQEEDSGVTSWLYGVVGGNGGAVVVGEGGKVLKSVGASSWESVEIGGSGDLLAVSYGDHRFTAGGRTKIEAGSGARVVTSFADPIREAFDLEAVVDFAVEGSTVLLNVRRSGGGGEAGAVELVVSGGAGIEGEDFVQVSG
ncbi:MAG: hypothetical protein P8J87_10280, partial [Verrucomicrobiales bacterium]|nr:hypothetical protein [Verrucomicrobiales bacterium]